MDKKHKQHRQKTPTPDELKDVAPPGASFDTDEGRAAHGMRKDLGGEATPSNQKDAEDEAGEEAMDEEEGEGRTNE